MTQKDKDALLERVRIGLATVDEANQELDEYDFRAAIEELKN